MLVLEIVLPSISMLSTLSLVKPDNSSVVVNCVFVLSTQLVPSALSNLFVLVAVEGYVAVVNVYLTPSLCAKVPFAPTTELSVPPLAILNSPVQPKVIETDCNNAVAGVPPKTMVTLVSSTSVSAEGV